MFGGRGFCLSPRPQTRTNRLRLLFARLRLVDPPLERFEPRTDAAFDEIRKSFAYCCLNWDACDLGVFVYPLKLIWVNLDRLRFICHLHPPSYLPLVLEKAEGEGANALPLPQGYWPEAFSRWLIHETM